MSGNTFRIQIMTPEKTVVERDAVLLNIPETTGRIGVEARHAPLAASLAAGLVEIVLENGMREKYDIAPGVFSFDANSAKILTSAAKPF
jgi:F0F1-type ATP synthase epsilon subunit